MYLLHWVVSDGIRKKENSCTLTCRVLDPNKAYADAVGAAQGAKTEGFGRNARRTASCVCCFGVDGGCCKRKTDVVVVVAAFVPSPVPPQWRSMTIASGELFSPSSTCTAHRAPPTDRD